MPEKVRCETCRRFFDSDENGWSLHVAANVIEGDDDGDWFCSSVCLAKYANAEWTNEIERRLRLIPSNLGEGE